jgi:uncharacterized protein with HEPN domain
MSAGVDAELATILTDIVFWGDRVWRHVAGVSEDRFLSDDLRSDAVCFCISCIGEAPARIRREWPDFAAANPDLELAAASAVRNRIVHGYFAVDNRIVWTAATVSIPRLVEVARKHLTASPA